MVSSMREHSMVLHIRFYLFPDTPQTLEAFRQLRVGQRTELHY